MKSEIQGSEWTTGSFGAVISFDSKALGRDIRCLFVCLNRFAYAGRHRSHALD